MKWRNIYVGLMCFCLLNDGMNGALLPLLLSAGPLLLGTLLASPHRTKAELLLQPKQHNIPLSFALLDDGFDDGGVGGGFVGNLISGFMGMNGEDYYNGPGSVVMNIVRQFRDIGLNVMRSWSSVLANVLYLTKFMFLTALRGFNTILARLLFRGSGRNLIRSGRQRIVTLLLSLFTANRPKLRNALQSGAILATLASNGLFRARTALKGAGGGGPIRRILKTIRQGIVNAIKQALLFRLQSFRLSLRLLPRDIISGVRGVKNTAQGSASLIRRIFSRAKSVFSRLNNGLVGFLARLPINILKRIGGRVMNMLKSATRLLIKTLAPTPVKTFFNVISRILGRVRKARELISAVRKPLKNVVSAARNMAKMIRSRARETLKDVIIAFIVSRAKLPRGLLPRPLKRLGNTVSKIAGSGRRLLDNLRKLFGGGIRGIVRRTIGKARNSLRNILPTPRNIIRRVLNRLTNRSRLLSRFRNLPTNILSIISILGNLRARRSSLRSNIRNDLMQIRQGLRSIILSLISNIGMGGGITRSIITRLVSGFSRNRPSAIRALTNIINTATKILRGGKNGGFISRMSRIFGDLYYVFEPFINSG